MGTYTIKRFYAARGRSHDVVVRGLTLDQARAHCDDSETSSSTCTSSAGCARTTRVGPWFDGYEEE